jgi:hypothetical protein
MVGYCHGLCIGRDVSIPRQSQEVTVLSSLPVRGLNPIIHEGPVAVGQGPFCAPETAGGRRLLTTTWRVT